MHNNKKKAPHRVHTIVNFTQSRLDSFHKGEHQGFQYVNKYLPYLYICGFHIFNGNRKAWSPNSVRLHAFLLPAGSMFLRPVIPSRSLPSVAPSVLPDES